MAAVTFFASLTCVLMASIWNTPVSASCMVENTLQREMEQSFSFEMFNNKSTQSITVEKDHDGFPIDLRISLNTVIVSYNKTKFSLPLATSNWGWKMLTLRCYDGHLALIDDYTKQPWIPLESLYPCQRGIKLTVEINAAGLTTNCREGGPVWVLPQNRTAGIPLNFLHQTEEPNEFHVSFSEDFDLTISLSGFWDQGKKMKEELLISGLSPDSSSAYSIKFQQEQMRLKVVYPKEDPHVFSTSGWQFFVEFNNTGSSAFNITQPITKSTQPVPSFIPPSCSPSPGDEVPTQAEEGLGKMLWLLIAIAVAIFVGLLVAVCFSARKCSKTARTAKNHAVPSYPPNATPRLQRADDMHNSSMQGMAFTHSPLVPVVSMSHTSSSPHSAYNSPMNPEVNQLWFKNAPNEAALYDDIGEEHIYEHLP